MKILYDTKIPKSRKRANQLTGSCFSFHWNGIVKAIQHYRVKHGYANADEVERKIESIRITDDGIQFVYEEGDI
jgi:hypothetical protein